MSSTELNRKKWHRIFGVVLTDLFIGSPFDVELEKDLSIKQQFLDVIVIRKRPGALSFRLPDGLEELAEHNLITYKSMNEALDDWALKELTGHYVNYRMQYEGNELQPEESFRMYGVSTRYPQKLENQLKLIGIQLAKKQDGVYEVQRDSIRIIVLREMPQVEHNAFWHMFSAVEEKIRFGTGYFKFNESKTTTVLLDLFDQYKLEGLNMPFTVEQYFDEKLGKLWYRLSDDQKKRLVDCMSDAERQHFLQSLSDAERQYFLQSLSDEDRLQGMSLDVIRAYLERRQAEQQQSNSESNDD